MRQVEIAGIAIEAGSGAPVVMLRETEAPHRVLPIFVGGSEAAAIGLGIAGQVAPRPLTHDLMAALVEHLGAIVERVEVTELRDGAFLAELALTGPGGVHRLDTRPSDAIALAQRTRAPLFVSDAVLDEAGAMLPEAPSPDPELVDAEVAAFRAQLDEIGDADLGADPDGRPDDDAS